MRIFGIIAPRMSEKAVGKIQLKLKALAEA
jgi:hypothetical protein